MSTNKRSKNSDSGIDVKLSSGDRWPVESGQQWVVASDVGIGLSIPPAIITIEAVYDGFVLYEDRAGEVRAKTVEALKWLAWTGRMAPCECNAEVL